MFTLNSNAFLTPTVCTSCVATCGRGGSCLTLRDLGRTQHARSFLYRLQHNPYEITLRNGIPSFPCGSATADGPKDYGKHFSRSKTRIRTSGISATDVDNVENEFEEEEENEHVGMSILKLSLPALGIVLSDPLMSVIDTACVGQLSSIQLAALGPNTLVFNFVFQVLSFLGSTTCNFMATMNVSEFSTQEEIREMQLKASRTLSQALCLAAILGISIAVVMELWGQHLLSLMGARPDYMEPALNYLRIRAVSVPAALMLLVGQGACLGRQDTKTPLVINFVAASFNLVGDLVFALWLGWGVTGAAWMTVFAQYLALLLLLRSLRTTSQETESELRGSQARKSKSKARKSAAIEIGWFGLPSRDVLEPYYKMGTSLALKYVFGMMVYISIGKVAASVGTLSIAAHQVAMQLFWFLSYFPESLSISAQSLVARELKDNLERARATAQLLLIWSFVVGCIVACAVAVIHLFGTSLLTSDKNVASLVISVTKQSMLCELLCSITNVIEGISVASGDVAYFPRMQLIVLGGMIFALISTYRAGWGLPGVWWSFVLFFGGRIAYHICHIASHWQDHVLGGRSSTLQTT